MPKLTSLGNRRFPLLFAFVLLVSGCSSPTVASRTDRAIQRLVHEIKHGSEKSEEKAIKDVADI
ncbi:MAG: hypothetical protein M1274_00370, partial [Actinobacteria bacterium]|nr:hypothetical protein [Actinomycetota bacterium]